MNFRREIDGKLSPILRSSPPPPPSLSRTNLWYGVSPKFHVRSPVWRAVTFAKIGSAVFAWRLYKLPDGQRALILFMLLHRLSYSRERRERERRWETKGSLSANIPSMRRVISLTRSFVKFFMKQRFHESRQGTAGGVVRARMLKFVWAGNGNNSHLRGSSVL